MKNLVFLYPVLILIHLPFSVFTGIDQGCLLLYTLDIVTYLYLYMSDIQFRRIVKHKISILWLLLIVYHTINSIFHNVSYSAGYFVMFMRMFDVYLLFMMCAYCYMHDKKKYCLNMLLGYSIFLVLTLLVSDTGNDDYARLEGSINATQIGQTAGCALFMTVLAKHTRNYGYLKLSLFAILPVIATLMAGSRNGLTLIGVALVSLIFGNMFYKLTPKVIILIVIGSIGLYFAADYVLNNTMVGERMLATDEQHEMNNLSTGTFLDVFGDRGVFYYYGWQYFIDNPIFGIGLWNFRNLYQLGDIPLHSEYMVHLCEGGIIGFGLYFTIILEIIKGTIRNFVCFKTPISFIFLIYLLHKHILNHHIYR